MKASQVMHTPAVVCRPNTTLRDVANLMASRNVGSVIVVDNIGYVAGIVTDRDVAVRGMGAGHSPETAVEDIMTRDVAAISPLSDAGEAASIMQKRAIRRVPVIDDSGHVHGLVSMDDLVRHLTHEADALATALVSQDTGVSLSS